MSLSKEGYVPSKLTLTCMDAFGLKTRKHKLSKVSLAARSQAKLVPSFAAKPRSAFDKENLLEQLRQEKRKHREMTASNGMLKLQLSNPKPVPQVIISASAAVVSQTLKREIQLLVQESEQKEKEIQRIKTSKKYNRFIELQSAKQVYLDQIKTIQAKISKNRTALHQQKRILRDHRRRQKDVAAMNKEVECNIVRANNQLLDKLEVIDRDIRAGLQKDIEQKRQKSKLLQEIMELQQRTGKVYIVNGAENRQEEQEEGGGSFGFQKDAILKDVTEKYDDSSEPYSQQDSSEEYQVSRPRLNVSY